MRLAFVSMPVLDQDRALAFYRDHLGFGVYADDPVDDEGDRWLALTAPEGTQEVQLLLEPADDAMAAIMRDRLAEGITTTVFLSDDLDRDYATLRASGVEFTMPPTSVPSGGADAIFVDSEGNLICLHED